MGEIAEYPRVGRPAYQPTEKERAIVENAAAFGEPHSRIARYLDIIPRLFINITGTSSRTVYSGRTSRSARRFMSLRPNPRMKTFAIDARHFGPQGAWVGLEEL
jgi:hypothetical protein